MGHNEPFWRTNSSFSPPLSRRWDNRIQSEGLSYESSGDGIVAIYASSLSSNSKESRSWVSGQQIPDNHYSVSDGAHSYFSSPANSSHNQQYTPPPVQGVNIDEHVKDSSSKPCMLPRFAEGTSGVPDSDGSVSSRSDDSEYGPTSKNHGSSHRSFSSCCSFMSKPIHPFSFTEYTAEGEASHGSVATSNSNNSQHSDLKSIQALTGIQSHRFLQLAATPQRDSSVDLVDGSVPSEPECKTLYGGSRCGLCERFLSQKSPWGYRRLVWSGDMPVASVLSCWHVYHAECLEQTTPKAHNHDPPCPLCEKSEESVTEQGVVCRSRNGLPRLRSQGDEGPSRVWSCGQARDCVEGAIDTPKQSNSLLLRNRSRLKRQLSLKGGSGKEQAETSRRSGLCSHLAPGLALKRW